MSCHSNQSEYALAFLPEQLNRSGPDGRNQLVAFTEAGYVQRVGENGQPLPPFDAASAAREPKLADPDDVSQPLEARARAYLHANCGHCHSDHGGGAVPLRLQFPVAVAEMKAVGVRPTRGDFGLPDARIIKPGDPGASTLYFRMAKFGRDRMPHIGSERPDEPALKLIEQWIAGMGAGAKTTGSIAKGRAADTASDRREVRACRSRGSLGAVSWRPPSGTDCWPRPRNSRPARSATCSRATCPRTRRGGESSARTRGPGPSWPSRAMPAEARSCSGRRTVNCGSCHKSATGARPSGRTCRPSESIARAKTC